MPYPRRSGVLLHPLSLPGAYGAGNFGASAYHFIDWLALAKQSLWQMLPLGDIGKANSPYMSPSAFAGNILLIDLEALQAAGWLADIAPIPHAKTSVEQIHYPALWAHRLFHLEQAAHHFFNLENKDPAFTQFCEQSQDWLDDYALFQVLKSHYGAEIDWQDWPKDVAQRSPVALEKLRKEHAQAIQYWQFYQWCFFTQWEKLKAYAHEKGVSLIGDMPIFVAMQSADVWQHPELFQLNANGRPNKVAGVPPDQFNREGQHWGNPLYHWENHAAEHYRWWIARARHNLAFYDFVRIDHFRGFESAWAIPASAPLPKNGAWEKSAGDALFAVWQQALGDLPFLAEDLGVITPEVNAMRERWGCPSMRILQFAFEHEATNPHLPHNYDKETVVYTGTHDNDTTCGWWKNLPEREKDQARRYLSINGEWIHWDLIRTASASVAQYALYPMQDILGLGSESRMNTPGHVENCWTWRFHWDQVAPWYAEKLAEITMLYGRDISECG